jgi:hypothetical protein
MSLIASLIASLILLWYKSISGIDRGGRSVKDWLLFDLQIWLKEHFMAHGSKRHLRKCLPSLWRAISAPINFYYRNFRHL